MGHRHLGKVSHGNFGAFESSMAPHYKCSPDWLKRSGKMNDKDLHWHSLLRCKQKPTFRFVDNLKLDLAFVATSPFGDAAITPLGDIEPTFHRISI